MRERLAVIKWRLGLCTCGGWACLFDSLTRCHIKRLCAAHDRKITSE